MTARRTANLVAVVLPPLAVVAAAVLSWNELVEPVDLVILLVGYQTHKPGLRGTRSGSNRP